ncbi:MAG: phosphatase PAP2 family protein [Planctomycetota bacterium]
MTLGLPRLHGLRLKPPPVDPDRLAAERRRSLFDPNVRSRLYLGAVATCGLVGLGLLGADARLAEYVVAAGDPWRSAADAVTDLCSVSVWGPLGVALGLGLWLWRQDVARAFLAWLALALIASGVTAAIVHVLKFLLGRARPRIATDYGPGVFAPLNPDYDFNSFPSGHAADIAVLVTTVWLAAPRFGAGRLGLVWLTVGLSLAATRVLTLSHWPSDVAAGMWIGVAVTLTLHALLLRRRAQSLARYGVRATSTIA